MRAAPSSVQRVRVRSKALPRYFIVLLLLGGDFWRGLQDGQARAIDGIRGNTIIRTGVAVANYSRDGNIRFLVAQQERFLSNNLVRATGTDLLDHALDGLC